MYQNEHEVAVAAFIRSRGVTRCPTACVLPTQGTIGASDRAALQRYAVLRSQSRQHKILAGGPFSAARQNHGGTR